MYRSFIQPALAIAWRQILVTSRNPTFLVPALAFPLFFMLSFGGGLSNLNRLPGFDYDAGYITFIYGFIVFQTTAFGSVAAGLSVAADFEYKFARRYLLAMEYRSAMIIGYALAGMVRSSMTLGILTAIAFIMGLKIRANALELLLMASLIVSMSMVANLWAMGVALRLRTVQAGPLMQIPILLTFFLAPAFIPRSLMEGWIRQAANFNPVTAFVEAARGLLAGEPSNLQVVYLVILGLLLAFNFWALGGLRKAEGVA
jgi:ABC-2 type transport system permease protein